MIARIHQNDNESRLAVFSDCERYRYLLEIVWNTKLPTLIVCGLNPSTADEKQDDPTLRRCKGFARAWGFGALEMLNIFAYRATDPRQMKAQDDPIGEDNDRFIAEIAKIFRIKLALAAWGNHGAFMNRGVAVKKLIPGCWKCIGLTKSGQPRHPLYARADSPLCEFP